MKLRILIEVTHRCRAHFTLSYAVFTMCHNEYSWQSISRSTGASKHHFALYLTYFAWCFCSILPVRRSVFFFRIWLNENVCDKQQRTLCVCLGLVIFLSMCVCLFLFCLMFWARLCLCMCVLFEVMPLVGLLSSSSSSSYTAFFCNAPLNFTYLIFQHTK